MFAIYVSNSSAVETISVEMPDGEMLDLAALKGLRHGKVYLSLATTPYAARMLQEKLPGAEDYFLNRLSGEEASEVRKAAQAAFGIVGDDKLTAFYDQLSFVRYAVRTIERQCNEVVFMC